jgi:hypothetical protein
VSGARDALGAMFAGRTKARAAYRRETDLA